MVIAVRALLSLVCLLIAAFCVFGFMASFEPGVGPGWKVGYFTVLLGSVAGAVLAWWKGGD